MCPQTGENAPGRGRAGARFSPTPQCDQSRMPRLETRLRAIHGPHLSVHRTLLGLWDRHRRVATGLASGGMPAALRVTDETARHLRYTSRAKREADVSLSHRCTMEHPVAPWSIPLHHGAPRCDGCY